jgi:hypothetical protein
MGKLLAPGVVSRPERKAGKQPLLRRREDWHTASPPAPSARRKKPRIWPWVLGIVLVLFLIGRCSDSGHQGSQALAIGKSKRIAALFVTKAGH